MLRRVMYMLLSSTLYVLLDTLKIICQKLAYYLWSLREKDYKKKINWKIKIVIMQLALKETNRPFLKRSISRFFKRKLKQLISRDRARRSHASGFQWIATRTVFFRTPSNESNGAQRPAVCANIRSFRPPLYRKRNSEKSLPWAQPSGLYATSVMSEDRAGNHPGNPFTTSFLPILIAY